MGLTLQVADVKRNLGSAIKMMDAGNKVVFDNEWSYIQHKRTGKTTTMQKQNGLMQFDILIPKSEEKVKTQNQFNALTEDITENKPTSGADGRILMKSIVRPAKSLGEIMMIEEHDLGTDEEEDDCQPAKGIAQPCLPSSDEVNLHNLTHSPFRAWCSFCVRGRAVSQSHYKITEILKIPIICSDYMGG